MNYDKIILELLDRIKTLEEKVSVLENGGINGNVESAEKHVVFTDVVRAYINVLKKEAAERGEKELVCVCNDIQKYFKVTNRAPSVCDAMYSCMSENDEVLFAPPSKYSTTVKIKYHLDNL